jgi:hypothetical protein
LRRLLAQMPNLTEIEVDKFHRRTVFDILASQHGLRGLSLTNKYRPKPHESPKSIPKFLSNYPHLVSLKLSRVTSEDITVPKSRVLLDALASMPKLRELHLGYAECIDGSWAVPSAVDSPNSRSFGAQSSMWPAWTLSSPSTWPRSSNSS